KMIHVMRPEAGSYTSNMVAASTLFGTTLDDRCGSTAFHDGNDGLCGLWLKVRGGRSTYTVSDGQTQNVSHRMVYQMGGDISGFSTTGDDWLRLGVMAGYGKQKTRSHNRYSGYDSVGYLDGYGVGLYGTWSQNRYSDAGLYVDSWVLYNWFDNEIKGDGLAAERYTSKGGAASVSAGYRYHAGSYTTDGGMENNIWLRPHAQVLWSGIKTNEFTEHNGTRVSPEGEGSVHTQLGMRLSMTDQSHIDRGTSREFEPFMDVAWSHNNRKYGVTMNGVSTYADGIRNTANLTFGVNGRLNDNLNIHSNVTRTWGAAGYSDTSGVLGIKYDF
ncbi:TPA: autotransporter outer membrane beta-barrel domain-containing protein, partial [Escherichia coli]|nr:autotransporter outer membrane beta-barrel domain-containing protein [Escherichia coli]HAX5233344.1 autotransporter outer membrane beta-barrel domain-containing protein [Escherichia coli]